MSEANKATIIPCQEEIIYTTGLMEEAYQILRACKHKDFGG